VAGRRDSRCALHRVAADPHHCRSGFDDEKASQNSNGWFIRRRWQREGSSRACAHTFTVAGDGAFASFVSFAESTQSQTGARASATNADADAGRRSRHDG
jgi:hypothetical protein